MLKGILIGLAIPYALLSLALSYHAMQSQVKAGEINSAWPLRVIFVLFGAVVWPIAFWYGRKRKKPDSEPQYYDSSHLRDRTMN